MRGRVSVITTEINKQSKNFSKCGSLIDRLTNDVEDEKDRVMSGWGLGGVQLAYCNPVNGIERGIETRWR